MVVAAGKLRFSELCEAQRLQNRRSWLMRGLKVALFLCGVYLLLAGALVVLAGHLSGIFNLFLGLVAIGWPLIANRVISRWQWRGQPTVRELRETRFTDEGIERITSGDRRAISWGSFSRWFETATLLAVELSVVEAVYVPKRFFADDEELERVRDLLRQQVGQACRSPRHQVARNLLIGCLGLAVMLALLVIGLGVWLAPLASPSDEEPVVHQPATG